MFPFDGMTMIERSIIAAQRSMAKQLLVVTGANHKIIEPILSKTNTESVFNKNWKYGIGSSIKCGLKYLLKKNADFEAVIISVCDQPYLNFIIFDGLIETYQKTEKKIVASAYKKSVGVPVLYNQSLFGDLLDIPNEHGAKKYIIEKASEDIVATFPFLRGEIDIDTTEDLKNFTDSKGELI